MTIHNLKADSVYLVIQRKLFTRFALPYEVILDSWCCTLNNLSLVSAETVLHFINSEEFSEDLVVLQLAKTTKLKSAYSFSKLEQVIFSSSEALELFLDRNYDNFDVSSLRCLVLGNQELGGSQTNVKFEKPSNPTPKSELVPNDGALALIFEKITVDSNSVADLENLLAEKQDLQKLLLSLFDGEILSKVDEVEVLKVFIGLCFENSLDAGWNPESILQSLHTRVSDETKAEEKFQVWEKKANDLFSGGELSIPLDDEGSAILRSIILVLLNPELDNLVAIKESLGDRIGEKVYRAARNLVLLRAGYSLLVHEERAKLGESRGFVQDLNAAVYNEELSNLFSSEDRVKEPLLQETGVIEEPAIAEENSKSTFKLADAFFVNELEERLNGNKTYSIDGIVPNAGFKSELIEKNDGELSLWLIDRRGDEKSSKYKGKMGLDLLQVQSLLPSTFRFEVDIDGVYLRLPQALTNESDLLEVLKIACQELALLKAFNARKSTLLK